MITLPLSGVIAPALASAPGAFLEDRIIESGHTDNYMR
jgi:hypothetical protein